MTILVSENEGGHRAEYIAIVTNIVSRAGGSARLVRHGWRHILSRDALMFMVVEDSPLECFLVSLLRGMMGKHTAAFLFKPAECLAPKGMRWRAKSLALKMLKLLPRVSMLTVIPFSVEPRLASIARSAIYDPQLWDLEDLGRSDDGDAAFAAQIAEQAQGRYVVAAMGLQSSDKGFEYLCRLLRKSPSLGGKYLFVAAGNVAPESRTSADELVKAGALVLDRSLTDAEMTALYRNVSLVWCCYAPSRDMASGIFGRAVQYGTPAIVRAGSYLEKLATELGHPIIPITWNDLASVERLMAPGALPAATEGRLTLARRLHAQSVAAILTAIGLQ